MMIDWLTLRYPLTPELGSVLYSRIKAAMGQVIKITVDGVIDWQKAVIDWDAVRSDSQGLFWSVTADSDSLYYLTIGGSPSSILNEGVNVFGDLDLKAGSSLLILTASNALDAILPDWSHWQCRRMDVTANYDLGSAAQVKQALRLLLNTDAPRRRSNSDKKGGDSVYWNMASDLRKGKAYHKGAHLRYQARKGNIVLSDDLHLLADRLLRLELTLGARWFRRLSTAWQDLTPEFLKAEFMNFFSSLIGCGNVEVSDMENLLIELEKVCPSPGAALAAHRTWALIRTIGFTLTKESMPVSTFTRHKRYLLDAGLSAADLGAGQVLQFRMRSLVIGQPVCSWHELRKAA